VVFDGRQCARFLNTYMNSLRSMALLGLTALCIVARAGAEENNWPIHVAQQNDAGEVVSWQTAGPLIFKKPSNDGGTITGFRPLFAQWRTATGELQETNILYPVFTFRTDGDTYRWSILQLINRSGDRSGRAAKRLPALKYETFDLWPFWFSRDTGSPDESYHALFPIFGTIKNRFGKDRLFWAPFPLYVRTEKKGAITTSFPWPILKVTRGTEHGFTIWPLYGTVKKDGSFDRNFYLWPLGWSNTIQPNDDAPAGTPAQREVGFLPFYTRETKPGLINENYVWPFFGYTDRTLPKRYHETRYFWPFLVRGRGDDQSVSRVAPFYTHSVRKGVDKKWVMWPVFRKKEWSDAGIDQTQQQVLYFLYWSLRQRSATNPHAAPAQKSHLWPVYSSWDNGAGRRQFQFPSPLEIFFPDNERIRISWSPLFSLYRYDQKAPGSARTEMLWGLISWRREPERREFHLGPLVSVDDRAGEKRFALGNGLVAWQRSTPASSWHMLWFDFPAKANKLRASSR
jgi:hypothetical protein